MIPGSQPQGWNVNPGAQPAYGAPQTQPTDQSGYGGSPYSQPPTPPGPYGPPSGNPYGAPSQPGYPGGYSPPMSAPGPMLPPTGTRRNPIIPIVIVVVLLAVVGGAFVFLKNHNSGGNIPSGFTTYTDTGGLFTMGYPSGWSKQDAGGSGVSGLSAVLFTNPGATDIFEVAELPSVGITTGDLSILLSSFFSGFASSLPGGGGSVGNTSSPSNVTIAGQTWSQESGDINYSDTSGNAATAHSEVAAISHNGHIFILADATQSASAFNSAKSQYFSPMINSFAFK